MRDALAALHDLAGLSLKDPFDEITAWQNSWYCAEDTSLLDPSSSSSSERDLSLLFSVVSSSAEKFTGDLFLGGDSDDEDLTGDLEHVELLESSKSLHLLTGVMDLLAGAWESLVLDIEGDLSTTLLSFGGLTWLSGTGITVSMRLCINVIIDIKSRKLAWLIRLGSGGKITLPSSDAITESCPCWSGVWDLAGVVPAGVLCPESSSSAGSATPAESSSSVGLANTAESDGLTESSPVAESAASAGPVTPAESSSAAGRAGDWMTALVLFSSGSGTAVVKSISRLDTWDDPGWSVASFSWRLWWCCSGRDLWSTVARDEEGRDFWSTAALGWWWWWWEEESQTSVAFSEALVDTRWTVESTPCLDLPDGDEGQVRSPLSLHLGLWRALGDSWRLEDPRSSSACNSMGSSIVSCTLFTAAATLRFCCCYRALSNAAHASGSQSLHTLHGDSLVHIEVTLLASMMVVTTTSKMWATRELELRFLRRRPVMWLSHHALLTGSERFFMQVGIKDVENAQSFDQLAREVSSHQPTFSCLEKCLGRPLGHCVA